MRRKLPQKTQQRNESGDVFSGNRCGHRPGAPVFVSGRADLPFLALVQDRAPLLYESRDWTLWAGRRRPDWRGGGTYTRPRPRSELREAIVSVVQYLAQFVQVKRKLRVLRFTKNEGIPYDWIMKGTGLSYDRVKDSLTTLRDCRYIGTKRQWVDTEGGARGRPSIRWINHKLFGVLGVWKAYQRLRKVWKMDPARESKWSPVRGLAGALRSVVPHRRI